jgi:type I restriction enzyme, S subunit
MKEVWKIKKISEMCDVFSDGNWIESKDQSPDGIRLVQTGNIGFGFFKNKKDKAKYISENTFRRLKCTEIFPGDLLVSRLPDPVGKSCIIPEINSKMITAVDCTIIRTNKNILPEFLLYFQMSDQYLKDVDSKVTGATRSRISRKNLGLIHVPHPLLPEQNRIVAILDKAFTAIDKAVTNTNKNLQNTKELFDSLLNEIFSNPEDNWMMKKLGDLGKLTSSKRIYKKEYVNDGVPFYRSKEIKELAHNRKITLELFITSERYLEIKSKFGIPQKGDILLTAVGTIGEMYVVKENDKFYFKDGNIMWLTNFSTLNTYYLKFALTSFIEQLKSMSRGSAYNALTIEKLKEYSVPVPTLKEQKQIVSKLDSILSETKHLESIYQQKLENLKELKQSILQKTFNGEL